MVPASSPDPVIRIAFRDDSIFRVAETRFSVAFIHLCCWGPVDFPMKVDTTVLAVKQIRTCCH